jgi:hypothetical protein
MREFRALGLPGLGRCRWASGGQWAEAAGAGAHGRGFRDTLGRTRAERGLGDAARGGQVKGVNVGRAVEPGRPDSSGAAVRCGALALGSKGVP